MASSLAPVTYVWRIPKAPYWASETRFLPTKNQNGEEHTSIAQSETNGFAFGLAPESKSDIILVPCSLGNLAPKEGPSGAIALCDSYLAAGGEPTSICHRPVLAERLGQAEVQKLELEVGFTVRVKHSKRSGTGDCEQRVFPAANGLADALFKAHIPLSSIRSYAGGGNSGEELEVVVGMGNPAQAADHAELVQAIAAGFGYSASIGEVWVSTGESRKAGGAASLLSRLTSASSTGVSANSRTGRFYIPANVARLGHGYYIDQTPAPCKTTYEYVMNVIDLWVQ